MKLIHYSQFKIVQFEDAMQDKRELFGSHVKPHGFWVSDEDDYGWSEWCKDENFHPERQRYHYAVSLAKDANILYLKSVKDIDAFTKQYEYPPEKREIIPGQPYDLPQGINWLEVASHYDGIIITPYQWERRLEMATTWYYGWDCASGCIWKAKAIGGIVDVTATSTKVRKRSVAGTGA